MTMLPDYTEDTGGVILDGRFDPDAQATVTDYIDYTEYLPADLIRSLTLIRGLDERYLGAAQGVHELTKTYGELPSLTADERPTPQSLRKDISFQLDRAINARESAYAEACRLYDVVDHHFNRLDVIRQKLEVLPKPASREVSADAGAKRAQPFRKKGGETRTRITLRVDNQDGVGGPAQKSRSRRSMADHFADLHPDSPIASTEHSDLEDSKAGPAEPPLPKPKKDKSRKSRPSTGAAGGISTSNALALLAPPPEDAKPGSTDMPWLRLTEWEMTKLRKKMKKNAIWQPSEVMIHRELALRGRGWDAYREAKTKAEAEGSEFMDCDDIAGTYGLGNIQKKSEAAKDSLNTMDTKLSNRGMKLNEAKKLKRENLAREQAAAAAAEQAGLRIGEPVRGQDADDTQGGKPTRASKRKLDKSPSLEATAQAGEESRAARMAKRRKTSPDEEDESPLDASTISSASITPATANEAIDDEIDLHAQQPPPPATVEPKLEKTAREDPMITTHPPSRCHSVSLTAEQATSLGPGGRDLRRKSATPARKTPVPEYGTTRRRKRPAPGPVSSGQDGGAAVSYGRRKAKLNKKRAGTREPEQRDGVRIDEDGILEQIDANEPRYCICGDVSFGTMICCENPDCDKEWFHLYCVGLSEVPSRTAKWFCPDCRVKYNKGADGIVKIGSGSRR